MPPWPRAESNPPAASPPRVPKEPPATHPHLDRLAGGDGIDGLGQGLAVEITLGFVHRHRHYAPIVSGISAYLWES